jgi:hypothetical protein
MGLFDRHPSDEELDKKYDSISTENRMLDEQRENLEKKAAIKQLEAEYGPSWKHILGVGSHFTLDDIRVFLRGAKQGMERSGMPTRQQNSSLNPVSTPPRPVMGQQGPRMSVSVLPGPGVKRA